METVNPDFLIMGWKAHEGFMVLGCNDMYRVMLQEHIDVVRETYMNPITHTGIPTHYELEGRLISFTLAHGDSYAEALRRLFGAWTPGDASSTPSHLPHAQGSIGMPSSPEIGK